jgi:hypothetical protein
MSEDKRVKVSKEEFKGLVDELYRKRQSRAVHPSGDFDKARRWLPSEQEECECCQTIRYPSRAYPFSLMAHCRTKKHIENLIAKRYVIE